MENMAQQESKDRLNALATCANIKSLFYSSIAENERMRMYLSYFVS